MPLSKREYVKYAKAYMGIWQARLDKAEAAQIALMVKQFDKNVVKVLEKLINELTAKNVLTPNQAFKLAEYKQFIQVAQREMQIYANFTSQIISQGQYEFANGALQSSQHLLEQIDVNFSRLPVDAITRSIGITSEGSPLYDVLVKRFGENVNKASDIFIQGVGLGRNPNKIAAEMVNQLGVSRYDAARICRTEEIELFRQISIESYQKSGIVDKYDWIAEPDACAEVCIPLAQGSPYALNVVVDSHPFCKCATAPHFD